MERKVVLSPSSLFMKNLFVQMLKKAQWNPFVLVAGDFYPEICQDKITALAGQMGCEFHVEGTLDELTPETLKIANVGDFHYDELDLTDSAPIQWAGLFQSRFFVELPSGGLKSAQLDMLIEKVSNDTLSARLLKQSLSMLGRSGGDVIRLTYTYDGDDYIFKLAETLEEVWIIEDGGMTVTQQTNQQTNQQA